MGILQDMQQHGTYAQLSEGKVRYEIAGPEEGEVVVLIHGLIGHMHVFDYQFKFLIEKGYRVLRFDLFGRGLSERVKGVHGSELYMSQVSDLIKHIGIKKKFHLVGLSMGGAISTRFTSHHPEKVKSIFLVDCYGIPRPEEPGIRLVQPKVLGEAFMGVLGGPILKRAPLKGFYDKKKHKDKVKRFAAPLAIKGSKRAVLSSLRNFMLENHVPHYERLNKLEIPKLILWGKEDRVLPFEYGEKIRSLVPNARFEVFEKCGHVPQFEEPEKFNALTLEWVKENS